MKKANKPFYLIYINFGRLKALPHPGNENYDAIIAGKSGFLNIPFFLIRLIIYLGSYALLGNMLVKYSNNEDELGGMFNYNKSFKISVIFLLIFGFTIPYVRL